jgi:hypothetical protein
MLRFRKQDFDTDTPGGTTITIAGYVLAYGCRPVVRAWSSYGTPKKLMLKIDRGSIPHATFMKIQRLGGCILTTQFYFQGSWKRQ